MKATPVMMFATFAALGTVALFTPNSRATPTAAPPIETREVDYEVNGAPFRGYLALPAGKGRVPGVLVIHEWWGHNEYARRRARMLAELGYAAFALDMYGKEKKADEPAGAQHLMTEAVSSGQLRARFEGALAILRAEPRVRPDDLAAIGYCFGGGVVLSMARAGEPLKAAVSFHGSLPEPSEIPKGGVNAEVLVLHGGADAFTSKDALERFKKEMTAARAHYRVVVYPGAKHGFTDPDNAMRSEMHHIPIGYDESADKRSWDEMKALFKKVL